MIGNDHDTGRVFSMDFGDSCYTTRDQTVLLKTYHDGDQDWHVYTWLSVYLITINMFWSDKIVTTIRQPSYSHRLDYVQLVRS